MRFFLCYLFIILFFANCKNKKKESTSSPELPLSVENQIPEEEEIIAPTDAFIKKYEGVIGAQYPIEFVLINWGNGFLDGYYFYKKKGQAPKKIELNGELNLDESFVINEYVQNDLTGKFTGSLSELETISGTWSNADSSKSMSYTLKASPNVDKKRWAGSWHRNEVHSPGTLLLGNVTEKTVDFALEVFSGGHNGVLEGTAQLNGGIATFKESIFGEEETCFLVFQKLEDRIQLTQKSNNWACGFGMRAYAEGNYEKELKSKKLKLGVGENHIFANQEQHDVFVKLVGEAYETFAYNMQIVTHIEAHPEDQLNAQVFVGNVAGLGTLNEAIIMRNDANQIWAATIDYDEIKDDFNVKYFTNDLNMKKKPPQTIEIWREDFSDYIIEF